MREPVLPFLKHMCYWWCCRRNQCHITGSQLPQATALYFTLFLLTLAWIYPTCHEIFIAPTFSNTCVVGDAVGKIRVISLALNCYNLQHCILHCSNLPYHEYILPAMRTLWPDFLKYMCCGWCFRNNPCYFTGSQLLQPRATYCTLFLLTLAWIYPTCYKIFRANLLKYMCCAWRRRKNPCHITGSQLLQSTALHFTLF